MPRQGHEVEERLQAVSEALRGDPGSEWAQWVGWALTAALRAAMGQHQPTGDWAGAFCSFDGGNWPCDTVKDVLRELKEL